MYQYSYLVEQVEVLLSQFEWKSRDSPTETRLTDRYRSTDSLSFVTPANFPRAMTVRRMANDVTYKYTAFPVHLRVQLSCLVCCLHVCLLFTSTCVCLLLFTSMFVVVYRSHSARVQKSSYENYAPGYVPSVTSFRRQRGVKAPTAQQQAPPTRQIFVEKEVIS